MSESPAPTTSDVIVVGAGLAGLSCAVRLHELGHRIRVFEAADGVGGRVRTDNVDGFLLDRGFQVYLDAYPEAGKLLDLEALDLRSFEPGALVWKKGELRPVLDVFRKPSALFSSAFAPIGSMWDKLLVAKLRFHLLRKHVSDIWQGPEMTTSNYLRKFGFSDRIIDDFFRSFYGGVFLEDLLVTSSRLFEFTFKMFSSGSATLPNAGMQAIPEQLATRLPENAISLNRPVDSVTSDHIMIEDTRQEADHIVLATDGATAARLLGAEIAPRWNSTSCLYFSADEAPIEEAIIALHGDREGLIHNLCVPSAVAPGYAPNGKSLISVSVIGNQEDNADLTRAIEAELVEWFGEKAETWKHLRTEHILQALPVDPLGNETEICRHESIWICGDHTRSGSIEGAIISGLETANRISEKE